MDAWNEDFVEQEIGSSAESFQKFLLSQRDLFHSQIDQFQEIVVTQCKLTGVNPLSQEMAAGALSIKLVRDFFTGQRSRVRRLVQFSKERALGSTSSSLNSTVPSSAEEASCSTQDAALSDLDDSDKHFVDNIFSLMQKEETFSGQEKLMEWILTIQNSSVLLWFLNREGGITLATWLNKATVEEQTSVLLLILKVLCHLPLHKAIPMHISAILQSVNKLRFYRASDFLNYNLTDLRIRHIKQGKDFVVKVEQIISEEPSNKEAQCIGQFVGSESWHSNIDVPEDFFSLSSECLDNFRKVGSSQAAKLLTPSLDDSSKKSTLGVLSSRILLLSHAKCRLYSLTPLSESRERRKIQLVEQPGQKSVSRNSQVTRAGPKPLLLASKTSNRLEAYSKPKMDVKEPLWEKCMRVQIPWKRPAEVELKDTWRVGSGENSKEVDAQRNRDRREKETIYKTIQEIPPNPKEPWDLEMDYDDTLTLEIPIEQLPDGDGADITVSPNQVAAHTVQGVASTSSTSMAPAEPDLELLAVLLKNPELVFALTSGQAGSIPSEEIVKLLDMIKRGGANLGLSENTNGSYGTSVKAPEKVEVSLPSPTPLSDPRTNGWSSEASKNPFSRRSVASDRIIQNHAAVATPNLLTQIPVTSTTTVRQQPTVVVSSSRHLTSTAVSPYSLHQATNVNPEKQQPVGHVQIPPSNVGLTMKKNLITTNASSVNFLALIQLYQCGVMAPIMGLSNSFPQSSFKLPSPTPSNSASHQHVVQEAHYTEPPYRNPSRSYPPQTEKSDHGSESMWRVRQDVSPSYHSQRNHNNYNAMAGGSRQSGVWDRNNHGREGFESWSPENSPTRNPRHIPGRNYPESRVNHGRNHRPEWSRERGSSGHWDPGRQSAEHQLGMIVGKDVITSIAGSTLVVSRV
uniref:Homeobox protein n=1 Tax=Phaseolus vulgaris TaxID=3885 RepID=E9NZV1_PHAVU|nr:homeobox protein [Phaseolus vulgaris]